MRVKPGATPLVRRSERPNFDEFPPKAQCRTYKFALELSSTGPPHGRILRIVNAFSEGRRRSLMLALTTSGIVAIAVAVLIVLFLVGLYNALVSSRMRVRNAFSQIDVQLKRRYDLIPNLVETVKGYATHEKETFERVIAARNAGINATGVAQQSLAENQLTGALRQLFAVAEAYPELKANTNFMAIQEELSSTENKIGFARQHYNNVVENYNTRLQSFPTVMVAGMLGFQPEEFFEMEDATQREAPKVKF
jgi:LemA protein